MADYPYCTGKEKYTPSFTLNNGVYLDVLAIDGRGKSIYGSQYVSNAKWRRRLHARNNTRQIELYSYE